MLSRLAILTTLVGLAAAAPAKRQSITTISSSQIASYTPYTWYAAAAYCAASETSSWSCGANCQANPSFQPVASGGDGTDIQYWYVGWDPAQSTVIVAHQGTDPTSFEADLTDGKFELETLDSSLFPGVSSSVEVHDGFAEEQAQTASQILSAVQSVISAHGAKTVTTVGHSLGAALSLLDAVYLQLHLSSSVSVRMYGYGLPRVGNQAFADYVDANLSGRVTHVNNMEDPIPTVPGMFLGFHHPSGEVHIQDSSAWDSCPGQDNPSTLCIVGDVPNVFDGSISDHDGPYNGITIKC